MKNIVSILAISLSLNSLAAQDVVVKGPDEKLQLVVFVQDEETPCYSVTYNGKAMLEKSPLGISTNIGDFTKALKLSGHSVEVIDTVYHQTRIKTSQVHYRANELTCNLENAQGQKIGIVFRVSNNDVAFRYTLPRQGGKGSVTVNHEQTGFRFPRQTTTFLCPQSDAMIGWKRTKPSYEEEYKADAPMSERSQYGHGYTFPCLFRIGDAGWVLVSETGVDSRYCGSRLSDYRFGRGTWSWILWQDGSINYDDQMRYIDFAAAMGYEYALIDNWWDTNIGRERMKSLIDYARGKGVELFLWYSSSGYWNDIEQGPINHMDNAIIRKREMKWLQSLGVKGIKVDFFGGDKQETMRLYEEILSDADDHGLMVIFHGCTLPRGWERMYPNYVGSEAVLASENMVFSQHFCDEEAFNTCLHPFIRNAVGCMEFGGCFLNKRLNRNNDGGTTRRTTDIFQLATAILFQNPVQNFALAPNNLNDVSPVCMDFMKQVPVTWDETRFIDGYPGKYVVLARRHGNTWYVAAVNAGSEPLKLKFDLDMFAGKTVSLYKDDKRGEPQLIPLKVKEKGRVQLEVYPQGGIVLSDRIEETL